MRKINRMGVFSVALAVAISFGLASEAVRAQCATCGNGAVDSFAVNHGHNHGNVAQPLFNNYFTLGASDQATAGMYMSPVAVPGWVGHTYNTYQPLYPHEFLYTHKDRYHSYYDCGAGLNRTHASYYNPPARTAVRWIHKAIEIPR